MLFAVLGGLFLMHGLSSHGAMHHTGSVEAAVMHAAGTSGDRMAAAVEASGAAAAHSGTAAADDITAGLPSVDAPTHGGEHGAQFAELCMAVLAGGLLLALLARRGGVAAVARARRTPRHDVALAFTGRAPDPPDLQRLSVCRC